MTTAIRIESVTKMFGELAAISELSLEVPAGTFLGLLGRNGAGKSTLIKMITGLMNLTQGTIQVLGEPMTPKSLEIKKRIGVMPEGTALLEGLTAPQYLRFVGRLQGLSDEVIDNRRRELFEVLELDPGAKTLIADYSYGMQKKTALCAALLHGPELLLLDEPFEGIDPITVRVIKDLLLGLMDKGTTLVLTSHALDLVEKLCPVLAIIDQGKLVASGTLEQLKEKHAGSESLEEVFLNLMGSGGEGKLSW
ncbi:MAG: multidrug ABC transporter ATP-binding protein [Planctomycetota bacterium]|nr:MAG: multidrug ABC transporter ATP-binding protein [Planctomycetota bacterium]